MSEWAAISTEHLLRLHHNSCPWNTIYWCRIRDLQGIPFHRFAGKHRDHADLVDISAGASFTSSYFIYIYIFRVLSYYHNHNQLFLKIFSASRVLRFKKLWLVYLRLIPFVFFSDMTPQLGEFKGTTMNFSFYLLWKEDKAPT